MGDVLSGIFGGGQQGSQNTTVDPVTQQMNQLKLDQVRTMLGYGGTGSGYNTSGFLQPSSAYTPSPMVDQLLGYGFNGADNKLMSFDDYMKGGQQSSDLLNAGVANNNTMLSGGIDNSNTTLNAGLANNTDMLGLGANTNIDMLNNGLNNIQGNVDASLAGVQGNMATGLQQSQNRFADAYKTAYNTGLDQTSNYISQIATPQIKQAMALQGLEGGGAVPEAIGKATATIGLPYMQSLMAMVQQYLQEQTGIQQTGQAQQLSTQQAGQAQQAGLYGQSQGELAGLYGNAQGQQTGLYNTAQQGQTSLYGGAQGQQASLYGTEMPLLNSFMQSLPGASIGLASAPAQIQATQAGTASTLFPMADYSRSLQEQDLLRRQGLVQTAMTGIPYTPSTKVQQSQSSQPLFNWFGQG